MQSPRETDNYRGINSHMRAKGNKLIEAEVVLDGAVNSLGSRIEAFTVTLTKKATPVMKNFQNHEHWCRVSNLHLCTRSINSNEGKQSGSLGVVDASN